MTCRERQAAQVGRVRATIVAILAGLALVGSLPADTAVPVANVTITLCQDGNVYSAVVDGNCTPTPPYEALEWDLSTHLADNGINAIACGTSGNDFAYNVRQWLVAGTNAATATITVTTMSGATWSTSGGNSPGSGDNLIFECDDPDLDYAGSIRLTADDGTSSDTTSTKTWAAFAQVGPPPPPDRVGIFLEVSGATLDTCNNCQASDLNSNAGDDVDGFRVKHLANNQYYNGSNPRPAVVADTDHWSILADNSTVGADSNVDSADGDNRFFRGTLYPEPYDPPGGTYGSTDLSYSPLNGDIDSSDPSKDKPRIDFLMQAAADDIHAADPTTFTDRNEYWLSFAVYLPSDYEEECNGGWQEAMLQYVSQHTTPNNQFSYEINGNGTCPGPGPGNATFIVERWVAAPGASSGTKPGNLSDETPVTDAMKGVWTYHSFHFRVDNRTSGATPIFEWWITDGDCNELHFYQDNTSRWGFDSDGAEHDYPNWNQFYKGGWHDATSGTYDGAKDDNDPVQAAFDAFRIGDSTSSFQDVHPIRCSEP